jgi:hypothetical protein
MFGNLVLSVDVFIALQLIPFALPGIESLVDMALFIHIVDHLQPN